MWNKLPNSLFMHIYWQMVRSNNNMSSVLECFESSTTTTKKLGRLNKRLIKVREDDRTERKGVCQGSEFSFASA